MGIQTLLTQIKPYAEDIKISLRSIFVEYNTPDLTEEEVWSIGLVSAYTLRNRELINYFESYIIENLNNSIELDHINLIKSLVTVITVKNTYSKAILKSQDDDLNYLDNTFSETVMNIHELINNRRFHLYALSCAAISAGQLCMQDEIEALRSLGVSTEAIHSVITIAAVLKGTSQALHMN